jgi:hypothetical protein
MGHMIDKLGYNKSSNDDHWVWSEISKIHGPAAVTEDALASRDQQIERLEAQVNTLTRMENERKRADNYMDRLVEDPEVLEVLKRKLPQIVKRSTA